MNDAINKLRENSERLKVICALAGFVLAGALLGASLTAAHYREVLDQERSTTRGMFTSLTMRMDDLAIRLSGTAYVQAATTEKIQEATSSVTEVAQKVDKAAGKAASAARSAEKAAKAKLMVEVPPEIVNREIRKANKRLKEGHAHK